jgi:hypothetical protein
MKRHFGKFEDKVLKASYEALRPMMPDVPATTARELENADRLNIAAGFMTESEKLPDYQAVVDNDFLK